MQQTNHQKADLKTPSIERIIWQTERRVFFGEAIAAGDKIVSLFEPHADIIVKGSRDVEYGHKLNLITFSRSGTLRRRSSRYRLPRVFGHGRSAATPASDANEGARWFHQSTARRSPLARRTPIRPSPDHRVARNPRGQERALRSGAGKAA